MQLNRAVYAQAAQEAREFGELALSQKLAGVSRDFIENVLGIGVFRQYSVFIVNIAIHLTPFLF